MLPMGYKSINQPYGIKCLRKAFMFENRCLKPNKFNNSGEVQFNSRLLNQLVESENPKDILFTIEHEISENNYVLPKESASDYLIFFLLDAAEQEQYEESFTSCILTIIANILKIVKKEDEIRNDFNQLAIDAVSELILKLVPVLLIHGPELQSKTIYLCSIIGENNSQFCDYLLSIGIISTFRELIGSNNTSFDLSGLFKFFKSIILNNQFDYSYNELFGKVIEFALHDDCYIRYKALKLIKFALKYNVFSEKEEEIVADKALQACLINDPDDNYTFDVSCQLIDDLLSRNSKFQEILLFDGFILSLFQQIGKINYIPGNFDGIDMIIMHYCKNFPSVLIENSFLFYIKIGKDPIKCKIAKLQILYELFDHQEIMEAIAIDFPIDQFNTICKLIHLCEKSIILKIIMNILRTNDTEYYKSNDYLICAIIELDELNMNQNETFLLKEIMQIAQIFIEIA